VKQLEEEIQQHIAKTAQLETYLSRAENFIIEQEATIKSHEKDYLKINQL
jgi:hypothetical protein